MASTLGGMMISVAFLIDDRPLCIGSPAYFNSEQMMSMWEILRIMQLAWEESWKIPSSFLFFLAKILLQFSWQFVISKSANLSAPHQNYFSLQRNSLCSWCESQKIVPSYVIETGGFFSTLNHAWIILAAIMTSRYATLVFIQSFYFLMLIDETRVGSIFIFF